MTATRWADALALQHDLAPADKALLLLLARLPFLSAHLASPLAGGVSRRQVERQLHRLTAVGGAHYICPPTRPGHAARLYYPTDLGLAVVALGLKADIHDLARRLRLRHDDLLARLPSILPLLAAYELLATVAASQEGEVRLLAWICPWRVRFRRLSTRMTHRVAIPAYAALAREDGCGEYLLLPDLASFPFAVYQRMLAHLALWQLAIGWCSCSCCRCEPGAHHGHAGAAQPRSAGDAAAIVLVADLCLRPPHGLFRARRQRPRSSEPGGATCRSPLKHRRCFGNQLTEPDVRRTAPPAPEYELDARAPVSAAVAISIA